MKQNKVLTELKKNLLEEEMEKNIIIERLRMIYAYLKEAEKMIDENWPKDKKGKAFELLTGAWVIIGASINIFEEILDIKKEEEK